MKNRVAIAIILVLLAGLGAIGIYKWLMPSEPGKKLTIGIATWPGFAAGMVGQEKGFFDGIELDFRIIDDLPARNAAFRSGDLDVMVSSVDLYVQEYSQGIEGAVILVTDESFGGDGIVTKTDIRTLGDLKNRRVAYARATPSHYLLYIALASAGLSPSDVEEVRVEDPSVAGQAFIGGSVDAAVTWEPFLTQVKQSSQGHVLVTSRNFPNTIVDILVASSKLTDDPETLKRFVSGWMKSVEYIEDNPEESSRIIAKGLHVNEADAQEMMKGLRFASLDRNRYFLCNSGHQTFPLGKVILSAGEFWQSQDLISSIPSPELIVSRVLCDAG